MTLSSPPFTYAGPTGNPCSTHLYVVEFSSAGIKVGRTIRPTERIREHHQAGRSFGHPVQQVWVSGPHQEAVANERALIAHCLEVGGGRRSAEYFEHDFIAAVRFAEALPMTWAEADADQLRLARDLVGGVRAERARAGLTQAELADLMGWSRPTMAKIERGERVIAAHELAPLCRAFGVHLSTLLVQADPKDRRILGI